MNMQLSTITRSVDWSRDHATKQRALLADAQRLAQGLSTHPTLQTKIGTALLAVLDLDEKLAVVWNELKELNKLAPAPAPPPERI